MTSYTDRFLEEAVARHAATHCEDRPIAIYDLPPPVRQALREKAQRQTDLALAGGEDDDEIPV